MTGTPQGVRSALGPRGHSVRRLAPFFRRKKANIRIKIVSKFQPNRSYRYPGIEETVKNRIWNAETERDRETDPILEGISPLRRHVGHGPEGKPSSHPGRRPRNKKKKEGGSFPLSPGGTGTPSVQSSLRRSTPTTSPPSTPTLPPLYLQRSTLPQPAVPST